MNTSIAFRCYILLVLLTALESTTFGAPYDLVQKYQASSAAEGFGSSFATLDGGKIAVGAPYESYGGDYQAGAVYVIDATTGNIQQRIENQTSAAIPRSFTNFGISVAENGDKFVVGTRYGESTIQKASLFSSTSNQSIREFEAPVTAGNFNFGVAMASMGSTMLVGAEETEIEPPGITVFMYNTNTGNLIRTFNSIGLRSGSDLSNSFLAVSGTNFLVGTPGNANGVGGATLIDSITGNVLLTLTSPTGAPNTDFGFSVATLPGNRFAVSAPFADIGFNNSGAVYVFDGTTGALLQTLLDPGASANGHFGKSIAAVGTNILIGAPGEKVGGLGFVGAAYLFSIDTGVLLHTFSDPYPSDQSEFGTYVGSIDGDFLISSPYERIDDSPLAGAIYRYAAVPESSSFILVGFGSAFVFWMLKKHP